MPRRRPRLAASAFRRGRRTAPTRSRARGTRNGCARRRRPWRKPNDGRCRLPDGRGLACTRRGRPRWAHGGMGETTSRHPMRAVHRRPRAGSRSARCSTGSSSSSRASPRSGSPGSLFTESFAFGWWGISFFVLFWARARVPRAAAPAPHPHDDLRARLLHRPRPHERRTARRPREPRGARRRAAACTRRWSRPAGPAPTSDPRAPAGASSPRPSPARATTRHR